MVKGQFCKKGHFCMKTIFNEDTFALRVIFLLRHFCTYWNFFYLIIVILFCFYYCSQPYPWTVLFLIYFCYFCVIKLIHFLLSFKNDPPCKWPLVQKWPVFLIECIFSRNTCFYLIVFFFYMNSFSFILYNLNSFI